MNKANFLEHVRDIDLMIQWYSMGAHSGNADALYALGVCHEIGRGVEKSLQKAFDYYTEAAAKDHPDALFALSEMYEKGICVKKSPEKAKELLERAAELGQEDAVARLAPEEEGG